VIDLSQYSDHLQQENGVWRPRSQDAMSLQVSYPADAHGDYFEIEEKSFWFAHRNACILQALRNFPPQGPVFDVGGGNGFVSQMLEREGFSTVLVEPGLRGIENAKLRRLPNLLHSTFVEAGIKRETVPAVGLFDVVEHLSDDSQFLSEIALYLKKEGKLIITVPAHSYLWSLEDEKAGHFRRYSRSSLLALVEKSEFKTLYATYFFSWLPLPIFLLRSLPTKLGILRTKETPAAQHRLSPMSDAIMKILRKREISKIRKLQSMSYGASLLIVASKK